MGVYVHHRSEQRADALSWFQLELANGGSVSIGRLEHTFGPENAKTIVRDASRECSELVFDGESRVVHIERSATSQGVKAGDGIELYCFGAGHGSYSFPAPPGTRIDRVVFDNEGLQVTLHGDLYIGTALYHIDARTPRTYHIKWAPDTPPAVDSIWSLIVHGD